MGSENGNALYALNAVLVLARHWVTSGRMGDELIDVLDTAEYLARLMAGTGRGMDEFRQQLEALADKYPEFALAVDRFDRPVPESW